MWFQSRLNFSLPKIETRSFIQCPWTKRLIRQNVPSKLLQVHKFRLKQGFHSTHNGNSTCRIGIIVFQQFWTTGSFATIDSCSRRSGAKGHFPSWHSCKSPLKQYFHQTLVFGFTFLHLIAFIAQVMLLGIDRKLHDRDPFQYTELVKLLGCRFSL